MNDNFEKIGGTGRRVPKNLDRFDVENDANGIYDGP